MDKGMFVSDDVTGRPPTTHEGMLWVGSQNRLEAAVRSLLEVKFEFVHALKVKGNASFTAIYFEAQLVLPSRCEPRPFDTTDCSILKSRHAKCSIIYINWDYHRTVRRSSLSNKRFQQA